MTPPRLTFRLVPNLQVLDRGVGFLEGHRELNAATEFEKLDEKNNLNLRSRVEHWVGGNNKPTEWFHVFKSGKNFRECFVFKLPHRRWYGFLCHPQRNSRFELCVLCIHADKYQRKTEKRILRAVDEWSVNLAAGQAISYVFPDHGKRVREWTH